MYVRFARLALCAVFAGSLAAGCGTSGGEPSMPSTNVYRDYLKLADEPGGEVIPRNEAGLRASLLCSGAAKELLGGVSIRELPTDLALLRSYCPDEEIEYQR